MFMFQRKRTNLVKRLWKARARRDETDSEIEDARVVLMKKLKESDLEILTEAVENSEGVTECVLIDSGLVDSAQLISCQTWRWPDLRDTHHLKQIPSCKSGKRAVCCNPYHWSRLCLPDSPPPPYCRFSSERLKPEDRAPSESSQPMDFRGSLSTNGEGEISEAQWCRLAYWELSTRVGRQYAVETPSVNVFWNLPRGDGLCLDTIAGHNCSNESIRRARDKIGKGLTLSKETDGVWAFNKSEAPMFVNSPALDDPESRSLMVYKVPPGYCLNIFSRAPLPPSNHPSTPRGSGRWSSRPPTGPIDLNSVRISFAKGWGPKYSRQEVTACPTWLEVLLAPCR